MFITKSDIKIPKRKSSSHKGDNGYVLAIGCCENYTGAIALAGLSALRSGCDLVEVIAPEKVALAINAYSLDLVTKKLKGSNFKLSHYGIVKKEIEKFDVVLIGNGIGLSSETKKFCKKITAGTKKLKIIDADAIKSISMDDCCNSIITPHSRELEIFLENSNVEKSIIEKIKTQEEVSKKARLIQKVMKNFLEKENIVLLKGKVDLIISKDRIFFVKGGNPGMTKSGTGDVLAGLCAGFLAQSKDILQSAINASYFGKMIGDILLKKKKGFTFLASDMVMEIKKSKKYFQS